MTTTAGSQQITCDDAVKFLGRTWTVTWINYSARQCPTSGHGCCNLIDLRDPDGLKKLNVRDCQVTPAPAPSPLAEGATRTRTAPNGQVVIQHVGGPQQLHTVHVRYASTGAVVDELRFTARTYDTAARIGNALFGLLGTLSVQQLLDALPNFRQILQLAA